jgi:GNAT superfamily N-acetyltransferase
VATQDGTPVARIVARVSTDLRDDAGNPSGMLGSFESIDDANVCRALFDEAMNWLRSERVRDVFGPMDGDTWHQYRLNNGPFDERPFLMEPYNPAYYEQLWIDAGFAAHETYHSKRIDDVAPVVKAFSPIQVRTFNNGYRLIAFDPANFDAELERLYKLSLAIFADNRLYTDISLADFRGLYLPVKTLVDPDFVWFAQSPAGEDVGFMFAIRDYHAALSSMRGETGLRGKARFWWHSHSSSVINVKSMGVVPGHRRSGLGIALINQVYTKMLARGFRTANLCLIHDSNPSSRLDAGHGRMLRRYTLYSRKCAP